MALNIPSTTTNQPVWVKRDKDGKVKYSLDGTSFHEGPLTWDPPSGSAPLTITFNLGQGVTGIATKSDQITLQTTATVNVGSSKEKDSFWVINEHGNGNDPKIVVTPT